MRRYRTATSNTGTKRWLLFLAGGAAAALPSVLRLGDVGRPRLALTQTYRGEAFLGWPTAEMPNPAWKRPLLCNRAWMGIKEGARGGLTGGGFKVHARCFAQR